MEKARDEHGAVCGMFVEADPVAVSVMDEIANHTELMAHYDRQPLVRLSHVYCTAQRIINFIRE